MRVSHRHDVVAPAAGPLQSPRRSARHPNRRMRLLHWPWVERYLREAPEFSLMAEAFAGPGVKNHLQCFLHPLLPFLPLDVEHLIIQKCVAGADPKLQSAA